MCKYVYTHAYAYIYILIYIYIHIFVMFNPHCLFYELLHPTQGAANMQRQKPLLAAAKVRQVVAAQHWKLAGTPLCGSRFRSRSGAA